MSDDRQVAASCLARAVSRFGPYKAITGRIVSFETQEISGECHEWEVPEERFEEFRDYVIAGDPWHKQVLGPVTLRFRYQFQWRDPDGSGPLAAQLSGNCTPDGQLTSTLNITLGRRTHANPSLFFPYAHDDPRLADLLSFVVPILPFKLAARHFYRGVPKSGGDAYTTRKFDATTLMSALPPKL